MLHNRQTDDVKLVACQSFCFELLKMIYVWCTNTFISFWTSEQWKQIGVNGIMAPNPKEQEDQVPIIINDSLEDDAISWDNTPKTGK